MEKTIRPVKDNISIEDIDKLDIRIGKIIMADQIEGTELIKQTVDFGPEIGKRTIVSKIAKTYQAVDLIGVSAAYILNLAPRKLKGVESQGMIVGITDQETGSTIVPFTIATPGSIIF